MTCQSEEISEHGEELMEVDVDVADASNGCITEIRENGLLLWPVLPQEYGEGLPYAPANWPSPGDIWGWKVGKRIAASGFHLDRYLYLPERLQKPGRKREGFASKLSAEQYVQAKFPGTYVNEFFSTFSWKIPSKEAYTLKGVKSLVSKSSHSVIDEHGSIRISSEEMMEQSPSDSLSGTAVCKAGNRFCTSLLEEEMSSSSAAQSCDVCCSESGFCRDCCCILCCNTIDVSFGGYSFIRCQATAHDGLICCHAAHISCALRSYMAGTVGGSVGLDTEYYCRRCDTRSDLSDHVTRLLKTCESLDSRDDIGKILSLGACLLRGSHKRGSQRLLYHLESALQKLKDGCNLDDVWKMEVGSITAPSGQLDNLNNPPRKISEDNLWREHKYIKLEGEINQVLRELRKSQELEYIIAQERLHAQKDHVFSLYQEVDKEFKRHSSSSANCDALLSSIAIKEESIKCELEKLKDMERVAKGFGKTPKDILRKHFDVDLEDETSCTLNSL